jgi:hypothetical protein
MRVAHCFWELPLAGDPSEILAAKVASATKVEDAF